MYELRTCLFPRHDIVGMHDRGRSANPWVDRDPSGIALHALRERLNVPRKCRGKQQRLAFSRKKTNDPLNVPQEPTIQHLIGLIHHEKRHATQL